MSEKKQCTAVGRNNKRCSFKCVDNSEYCSRHLEKINNPKKEVQICQAKNQKKEQCPWKAVNDEIYCKRHLQLLGNNNEAETKYCSGCKNYLPSSKWKDITFKICIKCSERSKQNRQKDKNKRDTVENKCAGFTQNKIKDNTGNITHKKCENYANKDLEYSNYCRDHQTLAKKISLEVDDLIVCSNWVRGCFNTFDKEIVKGKEVKKCEVCRKKFSQKDKEKYEKLKKNAIDFNNNLKNNNIFMCYSCNDKVDFNNIKNNKCQKCNHLQNSCEKTRTRMNPLQDKLEGIKGGAKQINLTFDINDEYAKDLIIKRCKYCNEFNELSGIDRVDSTIGYEKNNCVPCCKFCNIMKSNKSLKNFQKIIMYIVYVNKFTKNINESKISKYCKYFERAGEYKFSKFLSETKSRNISISINENDRHNIISKPCHYCKNNFNKTGCGGIDRINSSFGYHKENIVPCCKTCNLMKNIQSKDEFYSRIKKIYNGINHIIEDTPTFREQILKLLDGDKNKKHEKFILKNDDEYKKLIFNPKTLEEIKNVKISLEFCNSNNKSEDGTKLKDIWNYFRKNVSSLVVNSNAQNIGRQIYVLIKDNTTKKYLGIMCLSSDIGNMEKRDKYIGWDQTIKINKLQYIINMSTCVPLYPFGYNFNGGKLIASLAFSKEILEHYEKKYDRYNKLLGITTTSLYGKSIMYDRLKCFEFLGLTKGNSTYEINDAVANLCKKFLQDVHNITVDTKKKLSYMEKAFKYLGIPLTYLQSNGKGIYFGFTCNDSKVFLNGELSKCPNPTKKKYKTKTSQEIYDEWVDRWAEQRFSQLNKTTRFINSNEIYNKDLKNNKNNVIINDDFSDELSEIKKLDNSKSLKNKKNKNIIES